MQNLKQLTHVSTVHQVCVFIGIGLQQTLIKQVMDKKTQSSPGSLHPAGRTLLDLVGADL